ncbi:HTH-type transcriptional repressor of iron proteins A|nr:HTH-type transcriptional repressor of iron proteins A [Candidatus Pantoea persica]
MSSRTGLAQPESAEQWRLCKVLRDRLRLAPVLRALEANPGDNTTLAQWAARVFTTERTLARRCRQDLQMSFNEWRQRLRFLHAVALLGQGKSVQAIAHDLGYGSALALIVMFQQQAGTTPERYRARLG